jgi:PGAP1-like protein
MTNIILGIHGLSNKPAEPVLTEGWLAAINDGLRKVEHATISAEGFELAYWRDLRYPEPDPRPEPSTPPDTDDPGDDESAFIRSIRNQFTSLFGAMVGKIDSVKDQGLIDQLKSRIRQRCVEDLGSYYDLRSTVEFGENEGVQLRKAIRDRLADRFAAHRGQDILLIAHSMGSIIAYDVLLDLQNSEDSVAHFVTIGSPLGLADVQGRIREERGEKALRVPRSVRKSWKNYADYRDYVCADLTAVGEYENDSGIEFKDVVVGNGYQYQNSTGEWVHNYHNAYGYLRTPELAAQLAQFLG